MGFCPGKLAAMDSEYLTGVEDIPMQEISKTGFLLNILFFSFTQFQCIVHIFYILPDCSHSVGNV